MTNDERLKIYRHNIFNLPGQVAWRDEDISFLLSRLTAAEAQLAQWQQYAAYCRSCALAGEHDPHDFDAFVVRTVWPKKEQV